MKTIYYLGDIIGKVWNENDLPQVEIVATTLGREQLTLNNFIGDLLQTIEFYVPTKDTNGDGTPDFEWKVADGTFRQWKSGDPNDGSANTGILVQFPYILNDDKPILKIRLTLKIGNAESLPTHVYLDTIELGDTSSILIFRNGVNPDELAVKGEIIFTGDDFLTSGSNTEMPNISPIQYEEKYTYAPSTPGINNLGTFTLENIGNDESDIVGIDFVVGDIVKDYISFHSETDGTDAVAIDAGETETFTIAVDAKSNRTGDHIIDEFSSSDFEFLLKGAFRVNYDTDSYTSINVKVEFISPLLRYDYALTDIEEESKLNFNYKYIKANHKVLEKKLTLYNAGKTNLIISDIDTNYSNDGVNSAIVYTTSGDITILPDESYEFTFDLNNIPYPPKELDSEENYLTTIEEYNKEFSRNLIISSNAMNYSDLGSNANRTLAYENNSGINTKSFISSVYYDDSPYLWTTLQTDGFRPLILKPLVDSIAKLDIFNYDNFDSATNPSDHFKFEIVEYGSEVGTTAGLISDQYGTPSTAEQPLFAKFTDLLESTIASSKYDEFATYVVVTLPSEAEHTKYSSQDPEADPNQGGHERWIGKVRKEYDFVEDYNPFKILVTKVIPNSYTFEDPPPVDPPNQILIDATGTVDPKDEQTYFYDTNEKLLIYIYAKSRTLDYNAYSLFNYKDTIMSAFDSYNVDNNLGANEGIKDIDSYGLYGHKNLDYHTFNIKQTIYDILSYGLFNQKENSISSLFKTGNYGVAKYFFDINSYGLFNYKEDNISSLFKDVSNIYGINQHDETSVDRTGYSLYIHTPKTSRIDKFPTILPDTKFIGVKELIIKDVASYSLFNYKGISVETSLKDIANNYGSNIKPNHTNRYSYGLFNQKENSISSLFKTGSYGVDQYDPTVVDRTSYALFNQYNIDLGLLRGSAHKYPEFLRLLLELHFLRHERYVLPAKEIQWYEERAECAFPSAQHWPTD